MLGVPLQAQLTVIDLANLAQTPLIGERRQQHYEEQVEVGTHAAEYRAQTPTCR